MTLLAHGSTDFVCSDMNILYVLCTMKVLDLQEENETLRAWEEKITKGIRGGKRIVLQPVMLKDKDVLVEKYEIASAVREMCKEATKQRSGITEILSLNEAKVK